MHACAHARDARRPWCSSQPARSLMGGRGARSAVAARARWQAGVFLGYGPRQVSQVRAAAAAAAAVRLGRPVQQPPHACHCHGRPGLGWAGLLHSQTADCFARGGARRPAIFAGSVFAPLAIRVLSTDEAQQGGVCRLCEQPLEEHARVRELGELATLGGHAAMPSDRRAPSLCAERGSDTISPHIPLTKARMCGGVGRGDLIEHAPRDGRCSLPRSALVMIA
jgi:hypothetical protein